jgi:DNA helicase
MAKERLNLETEVQDIFEAIDDGRNFLLSGGAGSGKTYSLVNVIRQVIAENPTDKIACITYTNAAVKEIENRVNHKNLNVSTIHDFLWDNIKHFQKELKKTIIELVNDADVSEISISDMSTVPEDFFDSLEEGIQYKEYVRIREGIISHDELIIVAERLFNDYPKLCRIVQDKYKFIFIDEYQDTHKKVIEIFLTHFKNTKEKSIIGFFGDAMQSIYSEGIGSLRDYIGDDITQIKEIQKVQNRRNPQLVIDLANKLRTDGLQQQPSTDRNAPNMLDESVKQGKILFLYSQEENFNIKKVREYLTDNYSWNFRNSKETKDLNLTHNLIAKQAGFETLMNIYAKDDILSYCNRIKKYIKDNNITTDFSDKSFGDVIESLKQQNPQDLKKIKPTPTMDTFIQENQELYNYAKSLKYSILSRVYVNKDQLIDDKKQDEDDKNKKGSKRNNLTKHLFKIQNCIYLYKENRFNEFIKSTDYRYRITSIKDKEELKANIESLTNVGDKTIEEVIREADEKGICKIDDKLDNFKRDNEYLYNRVKNVKFQEFQKLYDYLEGYTPFSTQHKTKGSEYDNVLIILDNGDWNNYNFKDIFLETPRNQKILERTQKLFYVCCTRAKENLAIFFHKPEEQVINKAKEWFREENLIDLANNN